MKTQDISIVSIHPDPAAPSATDVKDILAALTPRLPHWVWCVRHLDWLGEDADAFCQLVEVRSDGLWVSSQDLLEQARRVQQTIEGEFLAFPQGIDPPHVDAQELSLAGFAESRAEVAVVAVDGAYFEVWAKDATIIDLLQQIKNVRVENPDNYF